MDHAPGNIDVFKTLATGFGKGFDSNGTPLDPIGTVQITGRHEPKDKFQLTVSLKNPSSYPGRNGQVQVKDRNDLSKVASYGDGTL